MSEYKGKPSGKYAEKKTSPGRKADYKRSGWPEDAPTQRIESAEGQQQGKRRRTPRTSLRTGGRNRKAGSPV